MVARIVRSALWISTPACSSASRTAVKSAGSAITSYTFSSIATSWAPASMAGMRSSSEYWSASTTATPFFSKFQATEPGSPRLPPWLENAWRTSDPVRLRLSVSASTRIATPPGP